MRRCSAVIVIAVFAPALHPETQDGVNDTLKAASRLRIDGRLREAEALLRGALVNRQQGSTDDMPIANLVNYLGIVLQHEGEFSEAETCFRRAVSDFETLLGPQHPQFAVALADLGGVLVEQGHYQEAYSLIRRAIDIATLILGDCDPAPVFMYSHLANLFYRQRDVARALPISRRTLACIEKKPGAETMEAGQQHLNLAAIYFDDGQYSLAQEHLARGNAILAKLLRPDHPDVLFGRNTQVGLYYKLGKFNEARELGLQLVEQIRGKLGHRHPALVPMLANVGYADQRLKLYREATECFQHAISIEEAISPRDPYLAELFRGYAAVLREAHRKPEAKQLELRAKTILANAIR
jgi:tetratricopeptide (TPR) repeat protein